MRSTCCPRKPTVPNVKGEDCFQASDLVSHEWIWGWIIHIGYDQIYIFNCSSPLFHVASDSTHLLTAFIFSLI